MMLIHGIKMKGKVSNHDHRKLRSIRNSNEQIQFSNQNNNAAT